MKNYPTIQATRAFGPLTPSPTDNVNLDPLNIEKVPMVYLHCKGASGIAEVIPAAGTYVPPGSSDVATVAVYLTQGQTLPLAIKRFISGPDCIAFY